MCNINQDSVQLRMTSFLETWVFWIKHWLCSLSRTTLQRLVAIQTEWLSLERVREGQVLDFMSFLQYLLVRKNFACTLHCYVYMLWFKYKCLLWTGLFQQAILQSGTELDSWSLQTPAENPSNYLRQVIQFVKPPESFIQTLRHIWNGWQVAERVDCPSYDSQAMVDCLRTVDAQRLTTASQLPNCTVRHDVTPKQDDVSPK